MRGFRIELGEIEAALRAHGGVREAVVVAREDARRRASGWWRMWCRSESGALERWSCARYLQQRLPEYMVPAAFVVLEELPLTPNGKVDRKALAGAGRLRRVAARIVAPRTATEEMLAGMWAEVLGLERVGVRTNFFELGGHSLLATQVMSRVREVFEVEVAAAGAVRGSRR